METNILAEDRVLKLIHESFITYCFLVDDRTPLPVEKQYYSNTLNKDINTVGRKGYEIEVMKFQTISQPYFVIVGMNEEVLGTSGYMTQPDEFLNFLNEGLKKFKP
jgi:thiol:disulfide interchange protein DsbD